MAFALVTFSPRRSCGHRAFAGERPFLTNFARVTKSGGAVVVVQITQVWR